MSSFSAVSGVRDIGGLFPSLFGVDAVGGRVGWVGNIKRRVSFLSGDGVV